MNLKTMAAASLMFMTACGIVGNFQKIYFSPVGSLNTHPAFSGTVYNLSGKIAVKLPNGEAYSGKLSAVKRPADPRDAKFNQELGFPRGWDAVFGEGYYQANIYASGGCFRGELVGANKESIYVEIVRPNLELMDRYGIAMTADRQFFKITF